MKKRAKIFINQKTGYIELFLKDYSGEIYGDDYQEQSSITVFKTDENDEVIGFGMESLDDLRYIDIPFDVKAAIILKCIRQKLEMDQPQFVAFLNQHNLNISDRSYQRIEGLGKALDLRELHNLQKTFDNEDWSVIFQKVV